jgi:hypothetical protein
MVWIAWPGTLLAQTFDEIPTLGWFAVEQSIFLSYWLFYVPAGNADSLSFFVFQCFSCQLLTLLSEINLRFVF